MLKYNEKLKQQIDAGVIDNLVIDFLSTMLDDATYYRLDTICMEGYNQEEEQQQYNFMLDSTIYNICPKVVYQVKKIIDKFKMLCRSYNISPYILSGGDLYLQWNYAAGMNLNSKDQKHEKTLQDIICSLGYFEKVVFAVPGDWLYKESYLL